jgi:hypothetical protein
MYRPSWWEYTSVSLVRFVDPSGHALSYIPSHSDDQKPQWPTLAASGTLGKYGGGASDTLLSSQPSPLPPITLPDGSLTVATPSSLLNTLRPLPGPPGMRKARC